MGTLGTKEVRGQETVLGRAALVVWAGVVAGAVALAGCGSVSGIPINQTATRIADTICPKAWTCCTADQLSSNSAAGTDVASCEAMTTQNYQTQLQVVQGSVDQHRASYQSAQVDACLATIMNSDCTTLNTTTHITGIPGCESFTTPLVTLGNPCTQDYECVAGWCNVPSGTPEGVCEGFVPLGQSCAAAGGPSCGQSAVCDPEGTLDDSSDDLCEPVSGNGGACTDDYQCTSLSCTSSGASGMTCAAPATPPAAMCFYSSGCSAAGGRPGAGTLLLFASFAAIAFLRAGPARRRRDR